MRSIASSSHRPAATDAAVRRSAARGASLPAVAPMTCWRTAPQIDWRPIKASSAAIATGCARQCVRETPRPPQAAMSASPSPAATDLPRRSSAGGAPGHGLSRRQAVHAARSGAQGAARPIWRGCLAWPSASCARRVPPGPSTIPMSSPATMSARSTESVYQALELDVRRRPRAATLPRAGGSCRSRMRSASSSNAPVDSKASTAPAWRTATSRPPISSSPRKRR